MKIKVLLTGGSGFVGINIAEALLETGNKVVVYSRRPMPQEAAQELSTLPGELRWAKGDVSDKQRLLDVLREEKIDYVVHAAAITPGLARETEDMASVIRVNVLGTITTLEAAREHNVKRFVYVSSVAVYGDASQNCDPVYESAPKNPHTTYELSKFATENLVRRYRELHGMDIVALRLGDVFGAWEYRTGVRDTLSVPYQCVKAALTGERVILAKEACTGWVYGKDCGLAVAALLTAAAPRHFAYNCGSVYRWSIRQWCELLKKHYNGFDFTVGNFENSTVRFHAVKDNGMFDMTRMREDTGFVPQFDLQKSFDHYIRWVDKYPHLTLEEPKR